MSEYASWYLSWLWWWAKDQTVETWQALPGPWWLKIVIVAVCLAIPGPQDEIALILIVKGCRMWRTRRTRQLTRVPS